jgi:hypothetical protein
MSGRRRVHFGPNNTVINLSDIAKTFFVDFSAALQNESLCEQLLIQRKTVLYNNFCLNAGTIETVCAHLDENPNASFSQSQMSSTFQPTEINFNLDDDDEEEYEEPPQTFPIAIYRHLIDANLLNSPTEKKNPGFGFDEDALRDISIGSLIRVDAICNNLRPQVDGLSSTQKEQLYSLLRNAVWMVLAIKMGRGQLPEEMQQTFSQDASRRMEKFITLTDKNVPLQEFASFAEVTPHLEGILKECFNEAKRTRIDLQNRVIQDLKAEWGAEANVNSVNAQLLCEEHEAVQTEGEIRDLIGSDHDYTVKPPEQDLSQVDLAALPAILKAEARASLEVFIERAQAVFYSERATTQAVINRGAMQALPNTQARAEAVLAPITLENTTLRALDQLFFTQEQNQTEWTLKKSNSSAKGVKNPINIDLITHNLTNLPAEERGFGFNPMIITARSAGKLVIYDALCAYLKQAVLDPTLNRWFELKNTTQNDQVKACIDEHIQALYRNLRNSLLVHLSIQDAQSKLPDFLKNEFEKAVHHTASVYLLDQHPPEWRSTDDFKPVLQPVWDDFFTQAQAHQAEFENQAIESAKSELSEDQHEDFEQKAKRVFEAIHSRNEGGAWVGSLAEARLKIQSALEECKQAKVKADCTRIVQATSGVTELTELQTKFLARAKEHFDNSQLSYPVVVARKNLIIPGQYTQQIAQKIWAKLGETSFQDEVPQGDGLVPLTLAIEGQGNIVVHVNRQAITTHLTEAAAKGGIGFQVIRSAFSVLHVVLCDAICAQVRHEVLDPIDQQLNAFLLKNHYLAGSLEYEAVQSFKKELYESIFTQVRNAVYAYEEDTQLNKKYQYRFENPSPEDARIAGSDVWKAYDAAKQRAYLYMHSAGAAVTQQEASFLGKVAILFAQMKVEEQDILANQAGAKRTESLRILTDILTDIQREINGAKTEAGLDTSYYKLVDHELLKATLRHEEEKRKRGLGLFFSGLLMQASRQCEFDPDFSKLRPALIEASQVARSAIFEVPSADTAAACFRMAHTFASYSTKQRIGWGLVCTLGFLALGAFAVVALSGGVAIPAISACGLAITLGAKLGVVGCSIVAGTAALTGLGVAAKGAHAIFAQTDLEKQFNKLGKEVRKDAKVLEKAAKARRAAERARASEPAVE